MNPRSGSFSENFPVLLPIVHQCHSHRQGSWCDWKCHHGKDSISPHITSKRRWYHSVLDSVWTSICWWTSKSTETFHGFDPKADAFVPVFCGHRETRGRFTQPSLGLQVPCLASEISWQVQLSFQHSFFWSFCWLQKKPEVLPSQIPEIRRCGMPFLLILLSSGKILPFRQAQICFRCSEKWILQTGDTSAA